MQLSAFARAAFAALALGVLSSGCGGGRSGGGGSPGAASTAAAVSSGAPATGATGAPTASGPADPLGPVNRRELARRFAPRLRWNAWFDDGNRSRQNRHEDHFPMGVTSFLRELHSGQARVIVQGSQRDLPGASELRPTASAPRFLPGQLEGYPRDMTGDAPGDAPLYVHVYDDPAARALAADGSGQLEVWADYWVFYPYDRAEVRILWAFNLVSANDLIGHRSDWEHVQVRGRVTLGPGAVVAGCELLQGYFYGHGHGFVVDPAELERVDDAGQPDPRGTHAVVYVAQGKHAAYPQAGHWSSPDFPSWLADYTDFFRGNGVVIDAWSGPLCDLLDPAGDPDAFASAELQALAAASGATLPDWTAYQGRWGPDQVALTTPWGTFATGSPRGPVGRPDWRDFGRSATRRWIDVKAAEPNLVVYADRGVVIPATLPAPAPVRR